MEQFSRIFSNKLRNINDTSIPVACSVLSWYETQRQLMNSAYHRSEAIAHKNAAVAQANLKYRSELQHKLEASLKKHEKNRKEHLTKIVKTEERKNKYVQDIAAKHNENEKMQMKERIRSFKEQQTHMEQFWSQQKIKRQNSYSEQVAAPSLYSTAIERKKRLEEHEAEKGLKVKEQILKKHENREQLVYKQVEKKQQEVHEVHNRTIQKNIAKHQEIVQTQREKFINDIGRHFAQSEEVLKKNEKQLKQKIKDKIYDEQNNMQTVRSSLMQKQRNRSATLSQCRCKRINNVEEGLTKSIALAEKQRHMHFTQTLREYQKTPTDVLKNRSDFLVRSYSVRSTVSKNQDMMRQRAEAINTERLRRQKEIADALALKRSLQVEGNCYVRVVNVK